MTMKVLVLVLSLGAVLARPDVSHLSNAGYQYKPPTNSYGVPVENGQASHQHHHHQVPSGSYLPAGLQVPLTDSHVNFLTGSGSGSHGQAIQNQHHQHPTGANHDGSYAFNSQLIQDQKHVYYYAAPDEEEHTHLRIHIAPNNQKNTNVIFVKAPSYSHLIPEVIAPASQAEEKTKVFVLVKKPEQPAPISIQAPAPVKTKPEVFVVKYDNQHEAEHIISGGRGGHPLGSNVQQIGDEHTFIQTLNSDASRHVPQNDKYSGFDGNVDAFATKGTLYGAPAVGGGGSSYTLRGNFGSDGVTDGSSSSSSGVSHIDVSSGHSDSGKSTSFDLGSSGSHGVSSESASAEHRGSISSGSGAIEGSSILGSTLSGSGGSGSSGFSIEDGSSGSQIGSSLDTLKLGSSSGSGDVSSGSSSSGSESSHGSSSSNSFGVRGNFIGEEGASVSSSFPSDSSISGSLHGSGLSGSSVEYSGSKSGEFGLNSQNVGSGIGGIGGISGDLSSGVTGSKTVQYEFTSHTSNSGNLGGVPSGIHSGPVDSTKSYTGTFEISGRGGPDIKEFVAPALTSFLGGGQGSGSIDIGGSKSIEIGSHSSRTGDLGGASSGTVSFQTGHVTYGPPGLSGPY